jgi:hypothetical protein
MIVTFRGFEYLPTQRAGALVLVKAAKYDRTQVRKDEKGRSWVFNNETNRWRVQRDGQDAPAPKAKKEAPPVEAKPKSSTSGLTRRIGSALKNGTAHIDALHQHLSKRSPIDKADLVAHIQGLVKRGKLFDHGDGKFGREPGAPPAPLKAKTNKQQSQPQQPRQKSKPRQSQPREESKPAKAVAKGATPTFKATEYNPHAIKDLHPKDFVTYRQDMEFLNHFESPEHPWNSSYEEWAARDGGKRKTRSAYTSEIQSAIAAGYGVPDAALQGISLRKSDILRNQENHADLAKRKERAARIQKAIDHPVMTPEETRGHKPMMSEDEASKYVAGSFTGGLSFYHGNQASVTQSITTDGAKPELNTRGIFGQGLYTAASKEEAAYYALSGAVPEEAGLSELISLKSKVKNPYLATAADIGKIGTWFPGDQSNNVDSEAVTQYLKAKGHDSIYLTDYGYLVTFDGKQSVSYKSEKLEGETLESAKQKADDAMKNGWDSTVSYASNSKTGAAMASLKRADTIAAATQADLDEDDF